MRIAPVLLTALASTAAAAAAPIVVVGPPPAAVVQYYLEIKGFAGESTAKSYENQIDALSFEWGESVSITSGAGASGVARRAGRPVAHDLTITKHTDKSSPLLMLACADGKHIPTAVLHATRIARNLSFEYLTVTIDDVLISSYQAGGAGVTDLPTETLTLNFTKLKIDERSQRPDGSIAPAVTATFDFALDKAQ